MTYYLVLFGALAVALVGFVVRRRSAIWGQGMIVLGCLGGIGGIAWQIRQTIFSGETAGPDRGQAVVGYVLANRVLADIGLQPGKVVLLFPPESVLDGETVGTYAGTFSRVLRAFPDLKVEVRTLAVPAKAARTGRLPLKAFQASCSNAPPAVACVSFAGVPADIENLQTAGQQSGPPFFVFDPWATTNWLGALKKGRIRTVIVPRPGVRHAPGSEISGEPQEVFDRLYLLATPASADEIAVALQRK